MVQFVSISVNVLTHFRLIYVSEVKISTLDTASIFRLGNETINLLVTDIVRLALDNGTCEKWHVFSKSIPE